MIKQPESSQLISGQQLSGEKLPVVDVRTEEAYKECHVAGSQNVCVYEIAFMEEFPKRFPDKDEKIVVYGAGAAYKADLAALGRLDSLGYTNILVLEGGLTQWKKSGYPVEGSGSGEKENPAGHYSLKTEGTKVRWIGRNLTNQHDGEVKAKSGYLDLDENGVPKAGEVVVDLRKMSCRDIQDSDMANALIGHLSNADFFQVEKYPEASFRLESVEAIENSTYGKPNFQVSGTLSARGRDLPLTVNTLVEPVDQGYVFQSVFNFDRTQVGACYGSGRLFERLGMHLVNDLVTIDVTAVFTNSKTG